MEHSLILYSRFLNVFIVTRKSPNHIQIYKGKKKLKLVQRFEIGAEATAIIEIDKGNFIVNTYEAVYLLDLKKLRIVRVFRMHYSEQTIKMHKYLYLAISSNTYEILDIRYLEHRKYPSIFPPPKYNPQLRAYPIQTRINTLLQSYYSSKSFYSHEEKNESPAQSCEPTSKICIIPAFTDTYFTMLESTNLDFALEDGIGREKGFQI